MEVHLARRIDLMRLGLEKPARVLPSIPIGLEWGKELRRNGLIILLAWTLVACEPDYNSLFRNLVYPEASSAELLNAGRLPCMHCPYYFHFRSNQKDLARFVTFHGLKQVEQPIVNLERLESLPKSNWWPNKQERSQMKRFWREIPRPGNSDGPASRLMLVRGEDVYFIWSGGASR